MDKYEILEKYYGYRSFREGQEMLIDHILAGKDVLGIMPTGAGKSVCYQVPALLLPGITLVISPLISLMKDQVQALNQAGVHAAYINSSLSEGQITKALAFAQQGRYKIIYVAPERLETERFLRFAMAVEISMVAVDEAHCISQWGQDFRPSYLHIVQFVKRLPKRPILSAFTATATGAVKEDMICVLGLEEPFTLVTGFDRQNLFFAVEHTKSRSRYLQHYVAGHEGESGIIYCATRKNVEKVYELLRREGVAVTRYHAGLSGEERQKNQDDFIYDRKPVIVATNAFGMGIDKSNVRYVLHYNMPQSMENYYQEAGRAGRDGEPSDCILLYSAQDIMINRFLIENKEANPDFTEEECRTIRERDEDRLQTMNFYCNTKACLRTYILRYFGEESNAPCGKCGNCQKHYVEKDMTQEAGKVIACLEEQEERFGINVVVGTLLGGKSAKLKEYRVDRYDSYGALSRMREQELKDLIGQMILEGYLRQTKDKYGLLQTTGKAQDIVDGSCTVIVKLEPRSSRMAEEDDRIKGSAKRRSDILNTRGLAFFEELRELRREIAREKGIPPYLVFSDKTLVDMCVRLPMSREEMLEVNGMGAFKYEKYGERFLSCIMEYTGVIREKFYFGD
ncbi:MAG: DNA helicase RecQ [Lachnospiraceae bacterium]|nr:DNA helicase RecQ [Lachnospiraceae bacterium]